MEIAKRIIRVLYHHPCPDGGFAALVAHLRFKGAKDTEIRFIPHSTFLPIDDSSLFSPNSEVYLLDYIGTNKVIPSLSTKVKKITLIDHHKTAQERIDQWKGDNTLPSNLEIFMRMDKSGATLAWEYFSKESNLLENQKELESLKRMFDYIEDNDLWRKSLPFCNEFKCGLGERKIEWDINKNPSLFAQLLKLDVDTLITEGKEKMGDVMKLIEEDLSSSFTIAIGGRDGSTDSQSRFGECLAVFTNKPQFRSDMGNQLASKSLSVGLRGMGAVVYKEAAMDQNFVKVSLRSIGDEDTSEISKHFNGGGHLNASSFLLREDEFEKWKI